MFLSRCAKRFIRVEYINLMCLGTLCTKKKYRKNKNNFLFENLVWFGLGLVRAVPSCSMFALKKTTSKSYNTWWIGFSKPCRVSSLLFLFLYIYTFYSIPHICVLIVSAYNSGVLNLNWSRIISTYGMMWWERNICRFGK